MSSGGAASEPLLNFTSIEALAALGKSLDLSAKDLQDFIVQQQEFEREERRSVREARKTELELSNRQKERESEERLREAEAQERQRVCDAKAEERQKQREHDLALANIRNEEPRGFRGEVEGSVRPTIVAKSPPKIDVPKFENKSLDDVAKYLDLFEKVMQQSAA